MKTRNLFLVICFLVASGLVSAQGVETVPLPKNLQRYQARNLDDQERKVNFLVGGNVGFGVGANMLQLQLAPHVGIYPAIPWLCFGVGGTYHLYYVKDYYSGNKSFVHIFGARGFLEGQVWKQRILLHAEYEWLTYPDTDGDGERENTHAILVGPGYQQFIGERFSMYGLLLFPIYEAEGNPPNAYSIMEARIGVNFKF